MIRALSVFGAMVALDLVFAVYVIECAARHGAAAGAWAAAVQICNFFVVTAYVKDRRMVLPCIAGAFVGTWLAVSYVALG